MFIARQFYKTTAVVKMLGKQDAGLPGMPCYIPLFSACDNPADSLCMHIQITLEHNNVTTLAVSRHVMCRTTYCTLDAGVTLNRSLYETVLRELLLERAEHTVELYEGSGAAWRKVRCSAHNHGACSVLS